MVVVEGDTVLSRPALAEDDGLSRADLYRESFHAIPAVTFLTDRRGVILDASRTAVAFLNVTAEAILMKPLLHFVARKDTRNFRKLVQELAHERVGPVVSNLRPRHGAPCAMSMTATRVTGRSVFIWIALPQPPSAPG